jgi:hypothetical protein
MAVPPRYRIALKQTPAETEVRVRVADIPEPEARNRLARLGSFLAGLSDTEFRQFGLALLAALCGN